MPVDTGANSAESLLLGSSLEAGSAPRPLGSSAFAAPFLLCPHREGKDEVCQPGPCTWSSLLSRGGLWRLSMEVPVVRQAACASPPRDTREIRLLSLNSVVLVVTSKLKD